ncbi:HTH domain-containing protein, partial [Methylogaea oryzae]
MSAGSADTSLSDSQWRLLRCLADGRFCSGAELARQLGLTRAAVWKQVHGLESLGLAVYSVAGRGYRLAGPLELLDAGAILDALSPQARPLVADLRVHAVLDSSNAQLLRLDAPAR